MNQKRKRFVGLFGAAALAVLLVSILFGVANVSPANAAPPAPVAAASANTLLAPASQGVTGSVQVDPGQPQGQTTTTNVNIAIPGWVWIVAVLLLVVIVALIASGNRGGGGTTVIKD